ncbi:ERF family protein [Aureimonas sp. AU20]|uniref:ERF family protein n=1 Tax=Aureimonas sp. AU20 TaxID=1349819 RepID=UPI000722340C|nr:ERF family protein [Aureimonas sp. AU20]ALN73562.1 hypothetical protein M673_12610 [Aureimonas sp. AU20]
MSNALTHMDTAPVAERQPVTPMEMLNNALAKGASVEMLEKLLTLQEKWESGQARRAFDAALSAAKSEIPVILKNASGHNNKRYADFAAIARVVDPIISKHGLSYRFRTRQDERIHVTCVLSHEAGHSEENTLAGPADSSGSKNAIQAIGSTLTYLQRYSLTQALGLAASEDDDGRTANVRSVDTISEDQVIQIREMLEATNSNVKAFLEVGRYERLEDILASDFDSAMRMLKQKAARR